MDQDLPPGVGVLSSSSEVELGVLAQEAISFLRVVYCSAYCPRVQLPRVDGVTENPSRTTQLESPILRRYCSFPALDRCVMMESFGGPCPPFRS